MSLIRQIGLLIAAMLVLALLGSVTISTLSAREDLRLLLQSDADETAEALALALNQMEGDVARMRQLTAAKFDPGAYRHIRYFSPEGMVEFVRDSPDRPRRAPAWFVSLVSIDPARGTASVLKGNDDSGPSRSIGTVEVTSRTSHAHDGLWRGCLRLIAAHGVLALLAVALTTVVVRRLRRPFDAVIDQAAALVEGKFVTLPEPRAAELQRLTRAMNSMVVRVKATFAAEAAQVEQLRLQAQCDVLTGVSNRSHFLGQLRAALQREDGTYEGGLVILRVCDLAHLNRLLGHVTVDRMLLAIAQVLRPYGERVDGCFMGRLNGADFALCVPVGGMAEETARALAGMLRNTLPAFGAGISVALGAVELRRDMPVGQVMAAADAALARAESGDSFAVELALPPPSRADLQPPAGPKPGFGQGAWRQQLVDALEHGRLKLVNFPLIDAEHSLVHLECMLRVQLQPDGPYEVAARWLPLATRSRLTAAFDERAVSLALRAIAADGQPRCINLSPVSLRDSGYAGRLRTLLFSAPQATRKLWLEVAEVAVIEQLALTRELGRQLRPSGVHWGLEHVGARLDRIDHLFEAGFEFVKLDASVTLGVGIDPHRANFVRGSVEMLHNLSLKVYAEGVGDMTDARALWVCGVEGITGPWASALRADAVN